MLARVRIPVFGDSRQTFECLVVLFLEVLRASSDQLLELGRANPQQLGLVACCQRVVRDLERLDPQVGVAVEDLLVDPGACLAVQQGFFIAPERLEHFGQQTMRDQFRVGELALLCNCHRPLEGQDGIAVVAVGNADATARDLHGDHRGCGGPGVL